MSAPAKVCRGQTAPVAREGLLDAFAIGERNESWHDHPLVPDWVDVDSVGLDAYFTRPEVASECYASLIDAMADDGADTSAYHFVEPAAGTGMFYDLLPPDERIGVDIVSYREEYHQQDFLSWNPPSEGNAPWAVVALWQVWIRGVNNCRPMPRCDKWIDLFNVDMRAERLCGLRRIDEADYFIQRTFFGEPPRLVKSFANVRYVCGYGIVIKRDKSAVVAALNRTDWSRYCNLAAHNARHISMYHIHRALADAGFVD